MGCKSKLLVLFLTIVLLSPCLALAIHAVKAEATPRTTIVPDDFASIQDALGNATAGDTVYVRAGNYTIPPAYEYGIEYGIKIGDSVTLKGENPNTTIIATTEQVNFAYEGYGILLYNDSEISGFTITGNLNVLGLFGNGRITNNIINLTSNGRRAISAISGTISSNIINGVREETTSQKLANGYFGIETGTTANTTISNNIIRGFGSGIYVWGVLGESKVAIINNTFANNNVGISITANPLLLQGNNIVNSTDDAMYISTNVNATYNWWGTTDAQTISNSITTGRHTDVSVTFTPFLTEPNPQAMPIKSTAEPPPSSSIEPFPTTVVAITSTASLVIASVSLLIYFKKRRRGQSE